jgi:hypothetical protein
MMEDLAIMAVMQPRLEAYQSCFFVVAESVDNSQHSFSTCRFLIQYFSASDEPESISHYPTLFPFDMVLLFLVSNGTYKITGH